MYQSLRDAAQEGSIDALHSLVRGDPYILDTIDKIPFVETRLHIAASAGHTQFAMEIMRLKPSLARKLNQDSFSPMHLALQNNQTQLVEWLLDVDSDIIRVPGKEGVTPFHYVAQMGNIELLTKFSKGCPKSYEDVTIRGENVLHVAMKYDNFEAFGLNARMDSVVSSLLDTGFVDLDAENLEGDTVFDILAKVDNQRISDMLMRRKRPARCLTALGYCLICLNRLAYYLLFPLIVLLRQRRVDLTETLEKCAVKIRRRQTVIAEEKRNSLLVVAALLITVTYQAALSPDKQPNEFNCTAPVNATGANQYFNFTALNPINATGANHYFSCTARFNASSGEVKPNRDRAGDVFLWCNTLTFYLTNFTLFFLLPPDFLGIVLFLLLVILSYGFCFSTPLLSAPILRYLGLALLLPVYSLPWINNFRPKHFSSDIE
ncbi:ankyrin repeat-containing protein BDA1-like [Corylus avellana]|uniref:ankyrin repeat-containing protein BDA1-like n=1 Tax=Corylus avellana TaxID=13451 RepID=UPI00286BE960|nr:ankyrin repeat-containing protein BDA1-like [Corylus avellana]